MTLQVDYGQLIAASRVWETQSEALHGAAGSLDDADTGCLGPRVQSTAIAFLNTWQGVVSDLESDAHEHGGALSDFAHLTVGTDTVVSGDLAGLMPYGTR